MTPEEVPEHIMELLENHYPYEAMGGYEACACGYGHGGLEEDYNAHILSLVIPTLTMDFVAKASNNWSSVDYSKKFGESRVLKYTVGDIKYELGRRFGLWE